MIFREAKLEDIKTLLELEQAVIEAERPFNSAIKESGATYYDIESLITNNNACLLIAEDSGKLIATGYAQIRTSKAYLIHKQHSYLGFMYVSPDYRGKSLNKQLIERLIEWSKSKEIHDFYLDVYSQNLSAIKAYEKASFKPSLLEMKLQL